MMKEDVKDPLEETSTPVCIKSCYSCGEEGHISKNCTKMGDKYLGKFPIIEMEYDQQEIEDWSNIERSRKKHKVFGSVMCWHCNKDGRYAPGCPCKDYDHHARRKTQTKKKRTPQDSQNKPYTPENTVSFKYVKNIEEKNASQKSKDGDDERSVY